MDKPRPSTRQGTDYGARDLAGGGSADDSESRGPEHQTLRKDPESDVGPSAPRSRSSSRESKSSGSMGSPKGSPVAGKKLRKERIAEDIKREDEGVVDRRAERESDMDYARFKFLGGLKELRRMAPTTTEAVVAVAKKYTHGPGLDKALLLDQAFQQQTESLFQWSDCLNKIGDSIFRLDVGGRKSLEPRLISKFCFAALDRDAGFKAMEQGPPTTLEEAVESVRWYQHVKGAVDNSYAERPRANVRGWSPEREKLDRRDQYQGRRDDGDSQFDRYRGNSRAAQSQSTYRARSPEYGRYEVSRADDAHDSERDRYQVRAVTGGLEAAVAELTKQVGGLTQEFRGLTRKDRGMKGRLDSIDTRLAKVEAWGVDWML